MKRVKKNQVIITALAIMIAVAGYINYAGNISDIISVSSKSGSKVVNTSTDDTIFTEEEPDDESLEEPGSVILTSGQGVSSSVISEAKLNREQIRAKNTENLTNIVNDTAIDKASKTEAINELAKIAEYSEKEAAPDPALPRLLESRPARRGDFQPSRKREGNRRLLLLRQYRRSCQNILAKHGRLARLLQSGRPRTPRDRNCGIYRRP